MNLFALRLTIVAAGLAVSASAAHAQLRAHWRFDELSGTMAADTAGGHPGTLINSAHFDTAVGIAGGSVRLDHATNDYVDMADILDFGGTAFSIQTWVKVAPGDVGNYLAAGRHHAGIVNGYIIALSSGSGYGITGHCWFYTSDGGGGEANSTSVVNDGTWHQIVGVYDPASAARIYVDGAAAEAAVGPGGFTSLPAPFLVGGVWFGGTPSNAYEGWVDDVQVYCKALSDAEVQFLFDHPGSEVAPCPANWNLDCRVDSQDFFDFLTAFFANNADFNHDGTTNSQDFFDFITAFFSPC